MERMVCFDPQWRYTLAAPREPGLFATMKDLSVKRRDLLAGTPLFGSIEIELLTELADRVSLIQIAAYESLFQKGDPGERMYVVVSGLIRIGAISPEGREVTYGMLGPGELLGEIAVLDGGERSADATAMENTQLLALERRDVLAFLDHHPGQAVKLMKVLCQRIRRADALLEDVVFLSLPSRLAKHLLALAATKGGAGSQGGREIRLSQQEIAEHLGISRESVNKVLSKWEEGGMVSLGRGRITINNQTALQDVASPP